jgi:hypothetical protein
MRNETEWIETVNEGWNTLGEIADKEKITKAVISFSPPDRRPPLYGLGAAAEKCVELIGSQSVAFTRTVGSTNAVRSEEIQVSVAVVGLGYWGKNLSSNFYQLKALAGLYDSNDSVKESYRLDYPDVKLYHDFGEVLSDSSLTAVALSTPAVTHYELAKAALTAGKDVFVEKPWPSI